MKKAMSFLLALVMALSLLPAAVWAEGDSGSTSEGNADTGKNALRVGGYTVYYATSVSNEGVVYCNANVNNTAKLGENGEISAFKVAGAVANEKYYIVVMWGENETEPTITLRQRESVINGEKKSNKTVFELTVPEVGTQEDTVVDFDLCVNSGQGFPFGVIFAKKNNNPSVELPEAAKNYMNQFATEDGYLKHGTDEKVVLSEDRRYTDAEKTAIKNAVAEHRVLQDDVRWEVDGQRFVYAECRNDGEMEFGEYLARLASKAGISLWNDYPSGDDAGVKLTANGHEIQFCTGMDYGILSYDERCEVKEEHPVNEVPYYAVPNGMNGFLLVVNATDGEDSAVPSLTLSGAESTTPGTNEYGEAYVTYTTDYGTVTIRKFENISSTKWVYGVDVNVAEGKSGGTLNFAAKYDNNENNDSLFNVVFEDRGWQPEEPDYTFEFKGGSLGNAPEGLKVLAEKGYKYPVLGTDVHFTFPKELKRWTADADGNDWDYKIYQDEDSGIVTVEVNSKNFNAQRWQDAVGNSEQGMMADGLFFHWYLGTGNNPPRRYGFDLMGNLGMENSDLQNFSGVGNYFSSFNFDQELVEDYYYTNGHRLATINRQTGDKSLLTIKQQGEIWFSLIAMDNGVNEEGATETATVENADEKFFMLVRIQPNGDYIDTLTNDNGTPVEKNRLHVTVTDKSDSNVDNWNAIIPTGGSVFMRIRDPNEDVRGTQSRGTKIAELTVTAPTGYTLKEWRNGGSTGTTLPATITNDLYQTVRLTWVKNNGSGETFTEYVDIECQNSTEWFNELDAKVTKPGDYTDADTKDLLEQNGINVEYDASIGYFKTTVDSSKLKEVSLLLKGQAIITAPDGARHYRFLEPGGSDSPALASGEVTRGLFDREEKHPVDRPVGMALMDWDYMELPNDGLVVYFAASQMYRELVVQWLGEDDTVIGYSYIYGRNGDFVTAVDTAVVDKLDNEEVEVPTLVTDKENLQFTCDKNPQTGSEDGRKLFLQFEVMDNSGENEPVYTVYLPYEYFNMTKEQGLALAAQGIKPTVTHYMDDACTTTKPIIDSAYTECGVMIVTDSFSPYVIDCSAQNEDNGSSGNHYYYTGSGSSDSTITSGADQTKQAGDIVKVTVKSGAKVQTVYVDGVALSAGDYIISGGTVKLQGTYTVKLAQGSHTLRIVYSDGSAVSTTFTLKGTTAPKTGDAGIAVYAVMALGGCTGAAALAFRRKRED